MAAYPPSRRLLSYAMLLLMLATVSATAQSVDLSHLYATRTYRSVSRRFRVRGPDMLDNMAAGRWAETVCDRFEQVIGGAVPFADRTIHIILRAPSSTASTNGAQNVACQVTGLSQTWDGAHLVQQMVVPRATCLRDASVQAAFCRLLIEGFFPRSRIMRNPVEVPRWLTVGLTRNLWSPQRGKDAHAVMAQWKQGNVMPLRTWLTHATEAWNASTDGPVSALVVAWLLDAPERYTHLKQLFAYVADGYDVDGDLLSTLLPGVETGAGPTDLEVAWDGWIMRQQRRVFLPGTAPNDIIDQLAAELLLYPGISGIPFASGIERGDDFSALIGRQDESWVAPFCRAKLANLSLLAVGRGKQVQATVDRYGAFLNALAAGKRSGRLKKLLRDAEASLRDLKKAVKQAASNTQDRADHDGKNTQDTGGEGR